MPKGRTPRAGGRSPFGHLLRRHRLAQSLTQELLAERSGISVETISALERGVHEGPRRDTAAMLADALGLQGEQRETLLLVARRPVRSHVERTPGRSFLRSSTTLVGRESEVAEVTSLVPGVEGRLLTLTGPPGVGKTRLALAVASALSHDFLNDIVLVDLAPVADPNLVASTIRQALAVTDERPLASHIGARRLLLVLDNMEHLLPAAWTLGELLARCPALVLLVTSRTRLHLSGEEEFPVEPLPVADAVTLLAQRGRPWLADAALDGRKEAVLADICRRLDCLPLALELVAPWFKLLEPDGLRPRARSELVAGFSTRGRQAAE